MVLPKAMRNALAEDCVVSEQSEHDPSRAALEALNATLNRISDEDAAAMRASSFNEENVPKSSGLVHRYLGPGTDTDWFDYIKKGRKNIPQRPSDTIAELSKKIKDEAQGLFRLVIRLRALFDIHKAEIHRRWKRSSISQRKSMLRAAKPDIPESHRPDVKTLIHSSPRKDLTQGDQFIGSAMLPYINLEDPSDQKSLLLFLEARAYHLPDTFAYSDLDRAPMYKKKEQLIDPERLKHTMMFIGQKDGDSYGQLVTWENDLKAATSRRSGSSVHLDHGCQILEIQINIWGFLLACCREIMPEVTFVDVDPALICQDFSPLHLPQIDLGSTSSSIISKAAPYCLPVQLDIERLRGLVTAQRNELCDQICQLREDPGYFAETVRDQYEHQIELVRDRSGKAQKSSADHVLSSRVLRSMIPDHYVSIWQWNRVQHLLFKWQELSVQHTNAIRRGERLPCEISDVMMEIRYVVEMMILDLIDMFYSAFVASPPWRVYFYADNESELPYKISLLPNFKWKDDPDKDSAMRIVDLLHTREFRDHVSVHGIMDEIENILQSNPAIKPFFTPRVASLLSKISVASECLHRIYTYQPWATALEQEFRESKPKYSHRQNKDYTVWGTKETTDKMRAAEAALDRFWKAADRHFKAVTGKVPHEVVKDIIGERKPHRTPPWTHPHRENVQRTADAFSNAASEGPVFPHDIDKQITGHFDKLSMSSKPKLKTKASQVQPLHDELEETKPPSPEDRVTVAVNKRAHKVFRSLFHSPFSPDQPGEISWADFLHAMVSSGFSAEKLQGSAWHFAPKNLEADRSIQFHEPHPGNKLPSTWAHQYGRRLTRAFGWDGETFKIG